MQVGQNSVERDQAFVDLLIIRLCTGVELGPDFALIGVQGGQSLVHFWPVKHGGVGDQDHFDMVQPLGLFQFRHTFHDQIKIAGGGWFAIA